MSTLQTDVRCRRSDRGVTVVELLVAVVIMGLLALLVSVPLQMTNRLSKNALDKATEILDSNLALRSIAKQLGMSQITRSGIITCSGLSKVFMTTKEDSFSITVPVNGSNLSEGTRRFTIPYSAGSSIGALSSSDPNGIHLTDASAFQTGDLVAVVSSEKSDRIGIFSVEEIHTTDDKPTLRVGPANVADLNSDCTINTGKLSSLAQFRIGSSAGVPASVFVQALQFAKYEVLGNRMLMQAYPRTKDYNFVAFENLNRITIQTRWYDVDATGKSRDDKDADGKTRTETNGSYLARVDVDLNETSMSHANDENGNPIQVRIVKPYSTYARYVMTSTKKMNDKAETNARPKKAVFPTCFLAKTQNIYTADLAKAGLPFRENVVLLSGGISESVGTGVHVSVLPNMKGSAADCINVADMRDNKTANKAKISKNSDFDLARMGDVQDTAICSVSGSVLFTGEVTYYDQNLGRVQKVKCYETVGSANEKGGGAKPRYVVDSVARPSCTKEAGCSAGRLVGADNISKSIIPVVDSCVWSDGGKYPCCSYPKNASGALTPRLTKVVYRAPSDVAVNTEDLVTTCK